MDRQQKQAALLCQLGGEHFRRHYIRPGAERPLPDVQRRVDVGVGHMAAADTLEGRLVGAILLVDASASRAFTRRVARINKSHGNTSAFRLVDDEISKLPEPPVTKSRSLVATSGRYPLTDTLELLKTNPPRGAFSIQNERLRNHVVCMLLVSPLSGRQFPQAAFRAPRPTLLQTASAFLDMLPLSLDLGAGVNFAVTVCCERHDPEIDAQPVFRLELFRFGNVAGCREYPFTTDKTQIDLALTVNHQSPLVFSHHYWNNYPALDGPKTDRASVFNEADDPVIVGLRGVGPKVSLSISVEFVGVRDFCDAPNGGLGGQSKASPYLRISDFVQRILPERSCIPRGFGEPIARLITSLQRRHKAGGLGFCWQHLESGGQLHSSSIEDFRRAMQPHPWRLS